MGTKSRHKDTINLEHILLYIGCLLCLNQTVYPHGGSDSNDDEQVYRRSKFRGFKKGAMIRPFGHKPL